LKRPASGQRDEMCTVACDVRVGNGRFVAKYVAAQVLSLDTLSFEPVFLIIARNCRFETEKVARNSVVLDLPAVDSRRHELDAFRRILIEVFLRRHTLWAVRWGPGDEQAERPLVLYEFIFIPQFSPLNGPNSPARHQLSIHKGLV